ncbi:MAG: DUF3048 domain-containing protein [Clostridium sp.]
MKKSKYILLIISLIVLGVSTYFLFPINTTPTPQFEANTTPAIVQKYYSDYTGLEVGKDTKNNIPFMIMIENSNQARPQSGLSSADIIYETTAEGGIPRFMALFQSEYPDTIGPVRSVRPYYLSLAKEQNLPFAHCGGSQEALDEISASSSLMSLNEILNGKYFWRDTSRKAPHNLYTSSKNILQAIEDKDWIVAAEKFNTFNNNYFNTSSLKECSSLLLGISNYYNTSYKFSNGLYVKSMNNELALDSNNNNPLCFSNIVIQKTNIKIQNDNLHLDVDLIGNGDGYVLSNGKIQEIKWHKDSSTSKTMLTDANGNEVPLSTGKTIWHIVDTNSKIQLN